MAAIDIQTATRAENFLKTLFFKPGGPKNFGNDRSHRCDRFYQIFVQIGPILAIFRPFVRSWSSVTDGSSATAAIAAAADDPS